MSTSLTGLSTNFFPSAQNGFQTTLASTISAGAATVPLNSVAGFTNGQVATLIIDPADSTKKQTFTGVVDTSGVQLTSVVWTAGTNVGHTGGATVVDYTTATHISQVSKGILVQHNQDGTHHDITSTNATITNLTATNITVAGTNTTAGWNPLGHTPNTVVANGNRSYTCTYNATDLTGTVTPGMRLQHTRTIAAPTQCTSLNGTTQYYSKTSPAGMTFVNNFVVSAWVKPSSYAASVIASRYNGTSGWALFMEATGQLTLRGYNAGSTNFSHTTSYQSIPLNKWSHIALQLDMSTFTATTTTSYVMIDGVDVPTQVARAGTNPTALIQAGNLEIGSWNGGLLPFPGKIAQVAIFSAKVTQATIQSYISQGLAGNETSLISAYSFNNSINDLNANANNLTANGSAVATNTDSPFGGQAGGSISSTLDYGIVTSASFSTNTTLVVQVPEGCTIPTSGGVSAVSYSTVGVPYGFSKQQAKWKISAIYKTQFSAAINATTANLTGMQMTLPIGEWGLRHQGWYQTTSGGIGNMQTTVGLSDTSGSLSANLEATRGGTPSTATSSTELDGSVNASADYSAASLTVIYGAAKTGGNQTVFYGNAANGGPTLIEAVCTHL